MVVKFLGTGTSQGIPVVACKCRICKSSDIKDNRLRTSVLIEVNNKTFVIDSGPDFRQQMLRENVNNLDAIIYTHAHKDHTAGMDDVRSYNYIFKKPMDLYLESNVLDSLKHEFSYVFEKIKYPGVPEVNPIIINSSEFKIGDISFTPIRALHHNLPILGFRLFDFTYFTDVNYISPEEIEKIIGTKILVINALRKKKHISHFNLDEALAIIDIIKPEHAYLTHISHLMGFHSEIQKELPENIFLAYDGLRLEI